MGAFGWRRGAWRTNEEALRREIREELGEQLLLTESRRGPSAMIFAPRRMQMVARRDLYDLPDF